MRPTDISNLPEVRRLAAEVKETQRPRVLKAGNEEIAVLKPVSTARRRKPKIRTEADDAAFLASAGSWKGLIDADKLLVEIAENRRVPRPPVDV